GHRHHGLSAGSSLSLPHGTRERLVASGGGADLLVRRRGAGEGLRSSLWAALPLRGRARTSRQIADQRWPVAEENLPSAICNPQSADRLATLAVGCRSDPGGRVAAGFPVLR